MFKIGWFSAKLFFEGKLVRDPVYLVKQTTIGASIGFFTFVLLAILNLPLVYIIAISSMVTGAVMPWLFKDLKMK
ncbi:hypothetical protein H6G04_09135 [Calothrix membranacea FACHB-236]|nr:hypothetical protein [Calothrix membranacea FACHB-236]